MSLCRLHGGFYYCLYVDFMVVSILSLCRLHGGFYYCLYVDFMVVSITVFM